MLSCNPPAQTSSQLTVGTLDSNGQAANFVGSARFDVVVGNAGTPANDADVRANVSISDVREQGTLLDYAGELELILSLGITDKNNGPNVGGGPDAATVQPTEFPATVPCTPTVTTPGSTCSLDTTLNALQPGAVVEEKRSNWELGVRLNDGGPDGDALTSPNTLFAKPGIFAP